MITDSEAYERLCEDERWEALRALTVDQSIALGEALLTSELMDMGSFAADTPKSLAISLGISVLPEKPDRAAAPPQ